METAPRNCRFLSLVVVERILRQAKLIQKYFLFVCHAVWKNVVKRRTCYKPQNPEELKYGKSRSKVGFFWRSGK